MKTAHSRLYPEIEKTIDRLDLNTILENRKLILTRLINYIQSKANEDKEIKINFICTHNSRRSHLAQVWAKAMAHYFSIKNVSCYSGGTEVTALYPKIVETLKTNGFSIQNTPGLNSVYEIKYSEIEKSIPCYSKKVDQEANPKTNFAAVLTCSEADDACPVVRGAEERILLTFEDPKSYDDTPLQTEKYLERSLQIATELHYVFSKIKTN